ncbi:hypothetical protein ABZ092_23675 [Streptomyces bobili]|uniref:hypothetical protein n=1 Tax=Streptomyces bobili TaxID=67280 RepID=UPI0033A04ECE
MSYAAFARELWMTAELNGRPDLRPDRSRIGHWVNDGQTPQHPMPDYLAQTLSRLSGCTVTVADLGLSYGPQSGVERLGVVDMATAFSRSVVSTDLSSSEIDELESGIDALALAYPTRRPEELWDEAMEHRQHAHALLHHRRHTLREGREIARCAGMLSVVLAWLSHDGGHQQAVEAWAVDATAHGQQADAPEVIAWAEDVLATDALYDNRPLDALTAATRGLAVAPRSGDASIRLTAQVARAQACLGNAEGFADAARRAEALCSNLTACWSGLFRADMAQIGSFNASSYLWLDRPREAQSAALDSISHYRSLEAPAVAPTRLAVAELDLALAQTALGEPDEAVRAGLSALGGERLVHAIVGRAEYLGRELRRRHPARTSVTEFLELVHGLRNALESTPVR